MTSSVEVGEKKKTLKPWLIFESMVYLVENINVVDAKNYCYLLLNVLML